MASTSVNKNSIIELRRRRVKTARRRRKQTSRTHDRLMVVIWLALYLPLLGTLVFMAMN